MAEAWTGQSIQGKIQQHPQKNGCTTIELKMSPYIVTILHPSMCCPELIHARDAKKPIRLIVGTDHRFYRNYKKTPIEGYDKSGWPFRAGISRLIARFVKFHKWERDSARQKQALSMQDILVSDCLSSAMSSAQLRNIACTYLGRIGKKVTRTVNNGPTAAEAQNYRQPDAALFALMRDDTVDYLKNYCGIRHVFEIQIHGLTLEPGSLYEIAWIVANKEEMHFGTSNPYTEWQDIFTTSFIQKEKRIDNTLVNAFNLEKGIDFTPDPDIPVQNHHFYWVAPPGKDRLDIGHLTDVHVSSRHHVFKKSRAQLVPGQSPKIGTLTHASFDALKDIMDQFGKGENAVDVLVFTGDLIDYGRNYNPAAYTGSCSGDIWEEMILDKLNKRDEKTNQPVRDRHGNLQPDTRRYPRAIDLVTMYSLFYYYYKKYGKPIILICGNHEAYTLPYGISPRAKLWRGFTDTVIPQFDPAKINPKLAMLSPVIGISSAIGGDRPDEALVEDSTQTREKDWRARRDEKNPADYYAERANEGIPADHNLTLSEAILMYGPDYARVRVALAQVRLRRILYTEYAIDLCWSAPQRPGARYH